MVGEKKIINITSTFLFAPPCNHKTYLHTYLNILGAENKNDNQYAALTKEKRKWITLPNVEGELIKNRC
jgi:hypothetical protein